MKENTSIQTRNMNAFDKDTINVYESLAIIAKRAAQIATKQKEDLQSELSGFKSVGDSIEEFFENREQIEISKRYEQAQKPVLQAIDEFLEGKTYHRNPKKDLPK